LRPGYRFILCLALLVVFTCLPAHAADPETSAIASLPVQQAYLAWMAEVSDAEMVATISYVETLYGADTGPPHFPARKFLPSPFCYRIHCDPAGTEQPDFPDAEDRSCV
jgi:hypothetical protein